MRRLMEDVKGIELSNGMEVVVQRTQTSTIAAELEVNAGALYEEKGEEGLAHFLEHVIVRSAREYNPAELHAEQIKLGEFNANTNFHKVALTGDMTEEDLERFLSISSAMAFSPDFNPEVIEEERKRILRDMADVFSNPSHLDAIRFRERM